MKRQDNGPSSTDELGTPRFAAANVDRINVNEVTQLVSEVPTGTKVSTSPAQIRPTLRSVRRIISRATVFASHWLNTPLKDGEVTVGCIFQMLKTMASNYQRTHQDAFFEAWPGMLILEASEELPHTNQLRADFEKYCVRAAHYLYHYWNGSLMLTASLANLLVLSRLNGNALTKDIAADTKWSRVNTYTNMYPRFPVPKGTSDYIFTNTAFAIGKTSYGADFVSIPMWIVDIFGNRGAHCPTLAEMLTNKGGFGDKPGVADYENPSSSDAMQANKLYENMATAMLEYGSDPAEVYGNSYHPKMPHVENGSAMILRDHTGNVAIQLNADKYLDEAISAPDPKVSKNQITATAWNNYMYWQDYMIRNFPEMQDPNSDFYVFFTTQLPLLEPAKTPKQALDIIHSLKNVDAIDLAKRMVYKKDNAVTTANIIKWVPLEGGSKAVNQARTNIEGAAHYFDQNFSRYIVRDTPTPTMIFENSQWPRLTPTAFANCVDVADGRGYDDDNYKSYYPFVANVAPSIGTELFTADPRDPENTGAVQVPTGKFAYLMDLASTRLFDAEHGHVSAYGISEDALKSFIDGASGIVFDEDASNVRCLTQPLIDNTDPLQCGFNVIVSANDQTYNEWGILKNESIFAWKHATIKKRNNAAKVPAIWKNNEYSFIHTSNAGYLQEIRYALVFVGEGIFDHPFQNLQSNTAALPKYQINMCSFSDKIAARIASSMTEAQIASDPTDAFQALELMMFEAGATGMKKADDGYMSQGIDNYIRSYVKDTNDVEIDYALFNPAYGPIKICTDHSMNFAGKIPVSIFKDDSYDPTQAKMDLEIVSDINLEYSAAGLADFKKPVHWDAVEFAAHYWLEALAEYQFNPSSFKRDLTSFNPVHDEAPDPIYLTDQGHTFRTFLAFTTAQFCGCDKYNPFWDSKNMSEAMLKAVDTPIAQTQAMPENYEMAEPRVPRSTGPRDKNYNDVKAKTTGFRSRAQESFDSVKGSGKSDASSKPKFHKHNKSGKFHNKMNADGIKGDSKIKNDEGSFMDASSPSEDKEASALLDKTKKMTAADLLQA